MPHPTPLCLAVAVLNLVAHRSASTLYRFPLLDHTYALLTFAKPRLALAVLDAAEDCSTVPLLRRTKNHYAVPLLRVALLHWASPLRCGTIRCLAKPCLCSALPCFTRLCRCHASPCFAVAVLSPAMLSRCFAGKCVAQLRLRFNARDCAMPLLCLSLPYFTDAMPCFALMGLDLPCSHSAWLSSAWLRLRFALRDYASASHISAMPLLILAAHRDAILLQDSIPLCLRCATIGFAVAMPCSALLCLRATARVYAWPLHGGSVLCFTFAWRGFAEPYRTVAVPYRAVKGHAVATRG